MTKYIRERNSGKGEIKAEYTAYRIVELHPDGSWQFIEGNDGYDYVTFRNANETAQWLNKLPYTKSKYEVKKVKVTVEEEPTATHLEVEE